MEQNSNDHPSAWHDHASSDLSEPHARILGRLLVGSDDIDTTGAVRQAYGALAPRLRAAIALTIVGGGTLQDAARAVGSSIGTVHRSRGTALRTLAEAARERSPSALDSLEPSLPADIASVLRRVGITRLSAAVWADEQDLYALDLAPHEAADVASHAASIRRLLVHELSSAFVALPTTNGVDAVACAPQPDRRSGSTPRRKAPRNRAALELEAFERTVLHGQSLRAAGTDLGYSHTHVARLRDAGRRIVQEGSSRAA